jgi:hypothetical protein
MAVPGLDPGIGRGHLEPKSAAFQIIGITGTRPVMTEMEHHRSPWSSRCGLQVRTMR